MSAKQDRERKRQVAISATTCAKIDELCRTYQLTRSAVVSIAVAKCYHSDEIVSGANGKRRTRRKRDADRTDLHG